jgi:hypothetical protein
MDGFALVDSRPGRLSLTVDKLKGNGDLARNFQAGLAAIGGVKAVETDPELGLVVVSYDHEQVTSLMSLLALKATFGKFFPEVNPMRLASWLSQGI